MHIMYLHFQPMNKRIDLFTIDSVPNSHGIIVNAIMDTVMESINKIVSYIQLYMNAS